MRTRKQSKFLATYLLKIHNKYDEACRKTKPADQKMNIWTSWILYVLTLYTYYKMDA
jgi:hypothetical protein